MATSMLCRRSLNSRLVPLTLGMSLGLGNLAYTSKRHPLRLDAYAQGSPPTWSPSRPVLDAERDSDFSKVISKVSGGCVSGFLTGLMVSVFSRTLVLLMGVTIAVFSIAAKYGIDLIHQLRLKEKAQESRILSALRHNTAFKLSFGVTFALSAFTHF